MSSTVVDKYMAVRHLKMVRELEFKERREDDWSMQIGRGELRGPLLNRPAKCEVLKASEKASLPETP